jgi:thioredoxin-related protein
MVKKIILAMVLLASSLMAADLHWAKDYQSAIEQATKQHKPVLLIVSSTKCKYCLLLDKTTLHDPKVIKALNRDFVAVRAWVNKGEYIPREIAQNTPGLPGIWFLYANGAPMFQPLLGYVKTDAFVQALGIVKEEFDKQATKKVKK